MKKIQWKNRAVELIVAGPRGIERFSAKLLILTLPLGVLQQRAEAGGVEFSPPLREKNDAIQALAMGSVARITMRFEPPFWPIQDFGFVHAEKEPLPTWWSHGKVPMLTGWTGGPGAWSVLTGGEAAVVRAASETLSRIFNVQAARIRESLAGYWFHDWTADMFARGAYSYTPAGAIEARRELGRSVEDTVFFAGEATNVDGNEGTVHGAIASGRQAAAKVLRMEAKYSVAA
jgi:monoamine oxidase